MILYMLNHNKRIENTPQLSLNNNYLDIDKDMLSLSFSTFQDNVTYNNINKPNNSIKSPNVSETNSFNEISNLRLEIPVIEDNDLYYDNIFNCYSDHSDPTFIYSSPESEELDYYNEEYQNNLDENIKFLINKIVNSAIKNINENYVNFDISCNESKKELLKIVNDLILDDQSIYKGDFSLSENFYYIYINIKKYFTNKDTKIPFRSPKLERNNGFYIKD